MLHLFSKENIYLVPSQAEQEITGLMNFGFNDFSVVKPIETMHTALYNSLHIVLSGSGTYRLGNKTYQVEKGDIFFTPMNIMLSYPPDKDAPWKYIWFAMKRNTLSKYLPLLGIDENNPVKKLNNFEQIQDIVTSALEECISKEYFSVYSCMALFMQFLAIEAKVTKPLKDTKETYMESIKAYIENNYTSPDFTVDALCSTMHLSHSYICRIFYECEGCTVINYIEQLRLNQAAKLLSQTKLNVSQIASIVGYSDPLHFMKRFKLKHKMTALSYRKEYSAQSIDYAK